MSIAIALLSAILAVITDSTWLYGVAAVLLIFSAVMELSRRRNSYGISPGGQDPSLSQSPITREDLSALGISNVRPRERNSAGTGSTPSDNGPSSTGSPVPVGVKKGQSAAGNDSSASPGLFDVPTGRSGFPAIIAEAGGVNPRHEMEMILFPFLQSLQAACRAHTVCCMDIDRENNQYRVAGVSSKTGYVRRRGRFSFGEHFLSKVDDEAGLTVLTVGEDGFEVSDIGLYSEPVGVGEVVVAPVRTAKGTVAFLFADALAEDGSIAEDRRPILMEYARLLGVVIDRRRSVERGDESRTSYEKDRPRREIIADEMAKARQDQRPLALALVYLNEAEDIVAVGGEAVEEAEKHLVETLTNATPQGRVERFGELMYGVFHAAGTADVEIWAQAVQSRFKYQDKGGSAVSIGVAVLSDRHSGPENLREDAAGALREAYDSGDCVIVG